MPVRRPSFQFGWFLCGAVVTWSLYRNIRELLEGIAHQPLLAIIDCGILLAGAVICFSLSIQLGNRLRAMREWRLPEHAEETSTRD